MTGSLRLYELAGADIERRFSPYCWRIRLALAHKGVPVETIAWRFTDKDAIAFSGQGKVPVLVDGETIVSDSWAIAEYLEQRYPERPSLFGGGTGRAVTRFVNQWADGVLQLALARLIVPDVFAILHGQDRAYFRETREKAFGCTLEELAARREAHRQGFDEALRPLRSTLAKQPFLAGESPAYADHIVFGAFQWARLVSPQRLVEPGDVLHDWQQRMLDAYDGVAGRAPALA
jgi:glutathione S-transferase